MFLRKELSGELVSGWVCTRMKIVFFISSFLAGKEAKEAGGTYEWFPLDPLSTFDGAKQRWKSTEENTRGRRRDSMQKPGPDGAAGTARPLSVAPAQGEEVDVSHQAEAEKYRASDVPPSRYWGGELCGADFSFLVKFLVLG